MSEASPLPTLQQVLGEPPWRVMTPEEYAALNLTGFHVVDRDPQVGVQVWLIDDAVAASCGRPVCADPDYWRKPPPHFKANPRWQRQPQSDEEWDRFNDPLDDNHFGSKRRLAFAGDRADPRAPAGMALVSRWDVNNILGRLTWLEARFENTRVGMLPAPEPVAAQPDLSAHRAFMRSFLAFAQRIEDSRVDTDPPARLTLSDGSVVTGEVAELVELVFEKIIELGGEAASLLAKGSAGR